MNKDTLKNLKVGIISSRFNTPVVSELLNFCIKKLESQGVSLSNITHKEVPGALEIPLLANVFALSKEFDVLIGVGAVIRGETYHFEVVSDQSALGVMRVQLDHNIPVINAIITTNSSEEAYARTKMKGEEAALNAIEMAALIKSL